MKSGIDAIIKKAAGERPTGPTGPAGIRP